MAGFDPAALQKTVETIQPNSVILVPELLKAWSLLLASTGQRAPASLAFVAVGGARIDAEAIKMARSLGLPVYQGYGLTECGSVVSLNRPSDDGDDVGRPLDHVQVRSIDGEIVIQSRAFLGYLGVEAGADEREFATGDLGHLDANGHLHLSGRRKNLLITSYARNIAPEWIEAALLAQPALLQAVVSGDARPWLSAVVVPALGANAATIAAAIARANATLPDYARIGHWITEQAPFALQNGMATSNGRPLRTAILTHYADSLAAGYLTTTPEHYLTKETADVLL
jgi:long-subunit acyl-CoA synthetase (AMP-forming)